MRTHRLEYLVLVLGTRTYMYLVSRTVCIDSYYMYTIIYHRLVTRNKLSFSRGFTFYYFMHTTRTRMHTRT